jgi:hypothetical protein
MSTGLLNPNNYHIIDSSDLDELLSTLNHVVFNESSRNIPHLW